LTTPSTTLRALGGALLLAICLLAVFWCAQNAGGGPAVLKPPATTEPLVPTRLPAFRPTATPRPLAAPPATPALTQTRLPTLAPPMRSASVEPIILTPTVRLANVALIWGPGAGDRARVGVGMPLGALGDYEWGESWPGWYLNWRVLPDPPQPAGVRFVQMVRVRAAGFAPKLDVITRTAEANPGALWLIGNEPDVIWQDNATSEQYAATYGVLYRAIKQADPTAQVAIGGVSQPTPLRMAYLDRILAAYRARYGGEMPVDVWNVHAFILREERDSWGVGIPPGMAEDRGQLYEITDHADLVLFRRQIADFRRWMAERGLRDKPLIVSEYGILMPESYGFPPELVAQFMTETFNYFLTARDEATGYPADDNRLVQAFCWYSAADTVYATPNLFDPGTRSVTAVGKAFQKYVAGLR
jgi:hypothetical protein